MHPIIHLTPGRLLELFRIDHVVPLGQSLVPLPTYKTYKSVLRREPRRQTWLEEPQESAITTQLATYLLQNTPSPGSEMERYLQSS